MIGLPSIRRRITSTLILGCLAWGIAVTAVHPGFVHTVSGTSDRRA